MEDLFDFEKYEFGIIENYEEEKEKLLSTRTFYNPKKYNCVKVLESFWLSFYSDTRHIETIDVDFVFKCHKGFDFYGGTIVPPSSLDNLKKCVLKQIRNKEKIIKNIVGIENAIEKFDKEFENVLKTIDTAKFKKKNIIFYGN